MAKLWPWEAHVAKWRYPILGHKMAILATFFEICTSNLFCPAFTLTLIYKSSLKSIRPKLTILSRKRPGFPAPWIPGAGGGFIPIPGPGPGQIWWSRPIIPGHTPGPGAGEGVLFTAPAPAKSYPRSFTDSIPKNSKNSPKWPWLVCTKSIFTSILKGSDKFIEKCRRSRLFGEWHLGKMGFWDMATLVSFWSFFWDIMANLGLIDFKLGLYIKVNVNARQNKFEVHISKNVAKMAVLWVMAQNRIGPLCCARFPWS